MSDAATFRMNKRVVSTTHGAGLCPFCDPPKDRVFAQDQVVIGLWDGYPVSPGYALIITRRHMPSWFDATEPEIIRPSVDGQLDKGAMSIIGIVSQPVGVSPDIECFMATECPFCTIESGRVIASNSMAFAIRDGYPVSPGHTLAIPNRHVGSFFDLSLGEQEALLNLVRDQKRVLDAEFSPAAFNVGINDGPAAGQTVPHVHVHLIPRYSGDVADPRGGVRWVLADRARYWSE
jgi:diadenosine tetraphosphate (Ap4A) HIT family hydrolase